MFLQKLKLVGHLQYVGHFYIMLCFVFLFYFFIEGDIFCLAWVAVISILNLAGLFASILKVEFHVHHCITLILSAANNILLRV